MSSHHTRRTVLQDENASSAITRAKSAQAPAKDAIKPSNDIGPLTRKRAALGELSKNVSTNPSAGTNALKPSAKLPVLEVRDSTHTKPSQEPRRRLRSTVVAPKSAAPQVTAAKASNNTAAHADVRPRPRADHRIERADLKAEPPRESLGQHAVIKRLPSVQDVRASKRPKVFDERLELTSSHTDTQNADQKELSSRPQLKEQEEQVSACLTRLQGIEYTWDDLDAEDIDDPTMVSEYAQDIFEHLWSVERKYLPVANYPTEIQEGGISWKTRGILIDWLVEVHVKFRLLPETFFLTVNIIDRYFSREKTALHEIQLFGVASLFIASKYEEVYCPTVKNLSFVAEGYTDEEILLAEKEVLRALEFDLTYPNPMNFLRRISKADDYDMETRTIGKYLLEVSLLDHRMLSYPPSWTSAAAMFLARLILDRPDWDGNLMHYSGYPKHDLYPVVNLMIDYIASRVIHEAFFKKYASRKFLKASILCRSWVKEMMADETKFRSIYPGYAPVEEKLMG